MRKRPETGRSRLATWLAIALLWAGPGIAGPEKLRVGMVNWPPAKIVENGRFGGTDVLMLEELAQRVGIVVEYIECPWRRCLVMLEAGDVDLISSITKSPERERYLQFIEPPYRNGYDIFFYTRGTDLTRYEDLQGLAIGLIRGGAYFDRFDQDRSLAKFAVTREDQLIEMLSRGRLEGHVIECPVHFARFDVRTGRLLSGPTAEDVPIQEVRVEGDVVYIRRSVAPQPT